MNHSALLAAVKQMENCLDEVKVWIARNSMFMDDGKIHFLPTVPKSADAIVDKSVMVWLQLRLRFVFSDLVFALIGTLT